MSPSPQKIAVRDLGHPWRVTKAGLVAVLKEGLLHPLLLDTFEAGLIDNIARRYGQYGDETKITVKQLEQIMGLAEKLCVEVEP